MEKFKCTRISAAAVNVESESFHRRSEVKTKYIDAIVQ